MNCQSFPGDLLRAQARSRDRNLDLAYEKRSKIILPIRIAKLIGLCANLLKRKRMLLGSLDFTRWINRSREAERERDAKSSHILSEDSSNYHAAHQIAAVDPGDKKESEGLSTRARSWMDFQRSIFGRWRIWSGNSFSGWWGSWHEQYAANLPRRRSCKGSCVRRVEARRDARAKAAAERWREWRMLAKWRITRTGKIFGFLRIMASHHGALGSL